MTHPCVLFVPCPRCCSPSGFPCLGAYKQYVGVTHVRRQDEYKERKGLFVHEVTPATIVTKEQQQAIAAMCERESSHPTHPAEQWP